MHQSSRPNTLLAIDLFDHNTLNSDHFSYGRVLDKLQQSYTPPNYPGSVGGGGRGGGLSGFLCLLDLISQTIILYLTLLMRDNSCK